MRLPVRRCPADRGVVPVGPGPVPPRERVGELVVGGVWGTFRNGAGRSMREWATVADPARDVPLGREALTFVPSLRR